MLGLSGDVKFIWYEFACPECGFQISVPALVKHERARERRWVAMGRILLMGLFVFLIVFVLMLLYAIPKAT
jgi:hypothetical protein